MFDPTARFVYRRNRSERLKIHASAVQQLEAAERSSEDRKAAGGAMERLTDIWDSRSRRLWIAIIVAGFALRAAWALLVPMHPISDSSAYDELAWNLASKGVYAWNTGEFTAYWPVGTSFFYSLPFRLFGHDYAPVAALNVLLGTGTLVLIMVLAQAWLSRGAALAAGALFAFWPMQIEFTSIMASELIFNLLMLLALWTALEARFKSMLVRALIVGIILAAATYVRVQALLFLFVIPVALIWRHGARWRELAIFVGAAGLTMAVCIAPWTIRNMHVLGAPVLISDNGGAATWAGNNPQSTGECCAPLPNDVLHMTEVERNRVLSARTKAWIRNNPDQFSVLFVRKLILTHNRETMGVVWNEQSLSRYLSPAGIVAAKAISTLYWLGALALAIAGAVLILRRERWRGLIHPAIMLWAYFAFVHAVTQASDRYHLPSVPFIAILAGFTLAEGWGMWRSRGHLRVPAPTPSAIA
jgi:4-amino-4-deoxy-L-arabinose transferase-like glycosyltransferase